MKGLSQLPFVLILFASFSSFGQKLIVRGDDMGFSHSGNEALIKTYKEGIETSIEVIVPSPWFPEAVKLLAENPGVDVGIHLVLTSEWDNVKWQPMTDAPSLRNKDGYFYPMTWPNDNYPGQAVLDNKFSLPEIEKEWRAQIVLAKKEIPRLSHISGHMGCTRLNEEVAALAKQLAMEYELDIDLEELGATRVGYDGPHTTPAEKKESFMKMLAKLERGKTYLFVEHPGIDTPELRAISHIGYKNVAEDRQGVTDLWLDAEVKALIQKKGIELVSYKDLVR